jgi:hypothetical protein
LQRAFRGIAEKIVKTPVINQLILASIKMTLLQLALFILIQSAIATFLMIIFGYLQPEEINPFIILGIFLAAFSLAH